MAGLRRLEHVRIDERADLVPGKGSDRLLTRDHGFGRTYFWRLRVLDPTRG